jgi:hypothetical protein
MDGKVARKRYKILVEKSREKKKIAVHLRVHRRHIKVYYKEMECEVLELIPLLQDSDG